MRTHRYVAVLLLKCPVLRNTLAILAGLGCALCATAQQPQVKLNVLNVCSPPAEEQKAIGTALDRIPHTPTFTQDFEIDRGRSLLDQAPDFLQPGQSAQVSPDTGVANWVRIRREFPPKDQFATVQYSFSHDPKSMVETLVFRIRDPKDLMQIAIEDNAASVTTPATMLSTDTPTSRIKLERFGQSSIVLARCSGSEGGPPPDQTAYEPLFQKASKVAVRYREILRVRTTIPQELARISDGSEHKASSAGQAKASGKKSP